MTHTPRWQTLLSHQRIGRPKGSSTGTPTRTEFDRDYDRIVFSSAFRRMQDKTQVFPLSRNDFTRTRLTHTLEVSSVGRTLGRRVADILQNKNKHPGANIDIGAIVAAACLAHDIGNPPFGHSGESAIQTWARKSQIAGLAGGDFNPQQLQDFYDFEGNAQAVRVVARLQSSRHKGGLELTLSTLGAMMKYPCGSLIDGNPRDTNRLEQKKFGYFADDAELITEALRQLGMVEYASGAFRRHPLAFLVEAADDICYAIADLEDSVDQRLICVEKACEYLSPLAEHAEDFKEKNYVGQWRLHWLRAHAIRSLIDECMRVFESELDPITDGDFPVSLLNASKLKNEYSAVKAAVRDHAYKDPRVLSVELAGFKVIGGLLDIFVPALQSPHEKQYAKLLRLFPPSYLHDPADGRTNEQALEELTSYQRALAATDYIAGMTDSYAVDLFQKLSGIRLPD